MNQFLYPITPAFSLSKIKFRKASVLFLMLLSVLSLQAKNYYFSSSTGNDAYTSTQAQNAATPWRSITKLNSFFASIVAGDNIYFKRGDIFYGSILATKSGTGIASTILFGAYGTGNKPIISGFSTLSTWTVVNGNIFESNLAALQRTSALNMVSINGIPQRMGRYPNYTPNADPYLYYESFTNNVTTGSITDNQLTTSTNWTGADVVIRKRRWITDKAKITAHTGGTLTYSDADPSGYPGVAGFGYFIQNDLRTVDEFGEWYINTTTKNLQMHFGGNQPTAYSVKASTVDVLLDLGAQKFITVQNLAFEGANVTGLRALFGSNITVQQCDFTQMGKDGIEISGSPNALLEYLNISYVMNNPVRVNNTAVSGTIVRNCNISNCSMYAGMGVNGDGSCVGLSVQVKSGATIEYNTINNVGYIGIDFQGNDVSVNNNFINNFCVVKDDGGGIYTWGVGGDTTVYYSNRKIFNNIILNGAGEPFGTSGKTPESKGIYFDGGSMSGDIYNNSIANIGRTGILLNNSYNVKITGNTIYNARFGVEMVRLQKTFQVRNVEMKKNIIYPVLVSQNSIYYKNFYLATPVPLTIEQDMKLVGKFDSNYYATPSTIGFCYYTCLDYAANPTLTISPGFTMETWKTLVNGDAASKRPARSATSISQLRFLYNETSQPKTFTLDSTYLDVDSTVYNGSVLIKPFSAKVLLNIGPLTVAPPAPPPAVTSLKATATVPAVNCSGGNTAVTVAVTGGTAPYTGTGTFSTDPGKGTLKLSFPLVVGNKSTTVFAGLGAINAGKYYILNFSTVGTTDTGVLIASIRQLNSPAGLLAPFQTKSFGSEKVNHKLLFLCNTTEPNARFDIAVNQASGTTYIDNISFFECNAAGDSLGNNLFPATSGQFETSISGVSVWSSNNNQVAEWDTTGKINSINYYTVTDALGSKSSTGVSIDQPIIPLQATATSGLITVYGGNTTVTINATGGNAPYTGTGTFTANAGNSSYTVTDANGCFSIVTIAIAQPASGPLTAAAISETINCTGTSTAINISATGGTLPYTGTGVYNENAGKGSIKISFPLVVSNKSTVLFAGVGSIVAGKMYALNFTTLGSTTLGKLTTDLRQMTGTSKLLTTTQAKTFGNTKTDHKIVFTATVSDPDGRFSISINQASGTTYVDNISLFETNAAGTLIGTNKYAAASGQFETGILGINVWSSNNNQIASWDTTARINNINYYSVTDAEGSISTVAFSVLQPATPLFAKATAPSVTVLGGTVLVTVAVNGGRAPYTITGSPLTVGVGSYTYNVTDANGCSTVATVKVLQSAIKPIMAQARGNSGSASTATTIANHQQLQVVAYPNPSSSDFNVLLKGGSSEKIMLVLMSIDGRIIQQTTVNTNASVRFGSNFKSGVYMLKIIQGDNIQTMKLIKAKN